MAKFKAGQLVKVIHSRKGEFIALVTKDFCTDKEEFYPLTLHSGFQVLSLGRKINLGEVVAVRGSLVESIEAYEPGEPKE